MRSASPFPAELFTPASLQSATCQELHDMMAEVSDWSDNAITAEYKLLRAELARRDAAGEGEAGHQPN